MERPPRDLTRDRLINGPLLRYAYLVAGILNVSGHARGLKQLWRLIMPVIMVWVAASSTVLQTTHSCCSWPLLPTVQFTKPFLLLVVLPVQAFLCMIAFFTLFWWNGVPLSVVYDHGNQYWQDPDSGRDLTVSCW